MKVIAISVGLHVIVGFIAGIIKVATIIAEPDAQFEVPPAVVEEELPVPVNMAIQHFKSRYHLKYKTYPQTKWVKSEFPKAPLFYQTIGNK